MGMCEGEGKEMMVDTVSASATVDTLSGSGILINK